MDNLEKTLDNTLLLEHDLLLLKWLLCIASLNIQGF